MLASARTHALTYTRRAHTHSSNAQNAGANLALIRMHETAFERSCERAERVCERLSKCVRVCAIESTAATERTQVVQLSVRASIQHYTKRDACVRRRRMPAVGISTHAAHEPNTSLHMHTHTRAQASAPAQPRPRSSHTHSERRRSKYATRAYARLTQANTSGAYIRLPGVRAWRGAIAQQPIASILRRSHRRRRRRSAPEHARTPQL